MRGRIFLTGGSGFVGASVIDGLLAADYSINALVNREPLDRLGDRVRSVTGNLFDDKALDEAMKDCSAVINLVGIIAEQPARGVTFERIHYEGTKRVVDAAQRAGIRRYLQMSALGARPDAPARYHRSKFMAQQYLRASSLDWTIIQPSIIHGPGGGLMQTEARWARGTSLPFLFMPYFGGGLLGQRGAGQMQPVFIDDVVRAFVESLCDASKIGEVFPIAGAERITWPQLHRLVAQTLVGRPRAVLAIPAWYAKAIAAITPAAWLPFNRDQVVMSQENNICDLSKFTNAFGWTPRGFEQSLRHYAGAL